MIHHKIQDISISYYISISWFFKAIDPGYGKNIGGFNGGSWCQAFGPKNWKDFLVLSRRKKPEGKESKCLNLQLKISMTSQESISIHPAFFIFTWFSLNSKTFQTYFCRKKALLPVCKKDLFFLYCSLI